MIENARDIGNLHGVANREYKQSKIKMLLSTKLKKLEI